MQIPSNYTLNERNWLGSNPIEYLLDEWKLFDKDAALQHAKGDHVDVGDGLMGDIGTRK